ncbi:MAG: dihydroorotate dehydrogenase [Thermodesulfovibrionales bacterium]|nr:dihydroorotate dehydrogenase [Thermodesulfovibrionales bacterium]
MGSGFLDVIKPNLSIQIATLKLKNPVMTASGTFGYGEEYSEFFDVSRLGAIVVKGLSMKPKKGNPPPRIVETPAGLINSIGLQNIGIDHFLNEKLPLLLKFKTPIIVNFFGDTVDEFIKTAEILSTHKGIAALEMNVSCPNKEAGWRIFGTDPKILKEVVSRVRSATNLPLIVKLSPNVGDIASMAKIAQDGGADAVSLVNTFLAMAVDVKTRRPLLANIVGGLSGPAIKPIAVRMVWEVCKAVNIPVIGMGGIVTYKDALEFLIVGSKAIAVGTANFLNPFATIEILEGIEKYMVEEGITDINQLIGSLVIDYERTYNN